MNNWKETTLSDFLVINPSLSVDKDVEYSFVEMPDLNSDNKYVEPSRKRKSNGLTKFQNRDTLFAKITPCLENGKICQVKNLINNIGVGSTEFFVFRGKEDVSDTEFVYYLIERIPRSSTAGLAMMSRQYIKTLFTLLVTTNKHKKKLFLMIPRSSTAG